MKPGAHKNTFSEMSVFEAENLLFESLQLLREPENLDPIRSKKVGEYWDETWIRAPFEECLTFRQLSTISHDVLVRKKSLNTEKMAALAHAVKRAVSGGAPNSMPATASPTTTSQKITEWIFPDDISATAATLLSGFSQFISKLPPLHPFRKTGVAIIENIDPLQFAIVWFNATIGEAGLALLGSNKTQGKKISVSVNHELSKILHEHSPELALHWKTAMTGVGASEEALFATYLTDDVPHTFLKEFGAVLVRALGAEPVLIKGKPLPLHWSTSPKSADAILKALALHSTKAKALETLSLPFPFFDLEALYGQIRRK